jgi:polyhydroxyalkanoate synthesis regulator phasin
VVDLANGGDMPALKLCLDRLCAPLRSTDRLIIIEGLDGLTELSDKGELILDHVATGKITPAEASSLMGAISSQTRILEVDELEKRITELENRNESK